MHTRAAGTISVLLCYDAIRKLLTTGGHMLVQTRYGLLEGTDCGSFSVFKGIPYACPPVGALRFRAPQPPVPWEGVRKADHFSAQCPQLSITDGLYGKEFYTDPAYPLPPMSEDCLYLNIWVPADIKEPAPVAFWIHGGGFDHGFGSEMEFDGKAYAERGVILVTINYRVGVFGFFACPELTEEDEAHACGNQGILDQIAALHWVKDNIAAFGGDPERITVFGQSAGAMSVQTLITSPLSRELMCGAIMQSGGGLRNGLVNDILPETAYGYGKRIMELCGAENLKEMRALPAGTFTGILPDLYREGLRPFRPVQDGYVLCENYVTAAAEGHTAVVPYMTGITADDIGVRDKAEDSELYKGCVRFAETVKTPVFMYFFNHSLPGDQSGAFHSSELWYTFGTLDRCWRPMDAGDYALSNLMLDCWTSFMKTGSPQHDWEPYGTSAYIREFR